MDPKAKKVVDAAMVWTDNPTVKNAGAVKSAVRGYREALKKEKAIVDARETKKKPAAKKVTPKKRTGTPPGVTTTPSFDTSEEEKKD